MLASVHGQHDDVLAVWAEVHGARKPIQDRPPCLSSDQSKLRWVVGDAFNRFVQRRPELGAKPGPPTFVPVSRFECFGLSLGPEADAAAHLDPAASGGLHPRGSRTQAAERAPSSANPAPQPPRASTLARPHVRPQRGFPTEPSRARRVRLREVSEAPKGKETSGRHLPV